MVAIAVGFVYYELNNQEHTHIEKVSATVARNVELLIQQDISNRILNLLHYAEEWGPVDKINRDDWDANVSGFVSGKPGYEAIGWFDEKHSVKKVWSVGNPENFTGIDSSCNRVATSAADYARQHRQSVTTCSVFLPKGTPGLLVILPEFHSDESEGSIFFVLNTEQWLKSLLPPAYGAEHLVFINVGDETVYPQSITETASAKRWRKTQVFDLYNQQFRVEVVPRSDYLALFHSRFITIMAMAGLLLSGLAMVAVFYSMSARYRYLQFQALSLRQQRLLKNLPGMAYQCSLRVPWKMNFVSEGCQTLCGYKRSELESHQVLWNDLIHPEDRAMVARTVHMAVAGKKPFELEYRIRDRDEGIRWMWERGRAAKKARFYSHGLLEGFITEITDRKLTESELIQAKGFSASIVDTAFEAVITLAADTSIASFNPAAEQIFGYSSDDVKGTKFLTLMHCRSEDLLYRNFSHFQATGEFLNKIRGRRVNGIHKDGSEIPIELSVSELPQQAEFSLVCFIRDLSEQTAAEQEAAEHREKLAHADRINILGEMVTGIAHEINQPLTTISLFSQAGRRMLDSGQACQLPNVFDKLSHHARRAGLIIERIQNMARQHITTPEIVDSNEMIREIVALAEADAKGLDIVINLELAERLPVVEVDSVQVQQVLLNLLRNGMEAMQAVDCVNGNIITIRSRSRDEGVIEIAVIDSGCGISEEVAKSLFTSFFNQQKKRHGHGAFHQ